MMQRKEYLYIFALVLSKIIPVAGWCLTKDAKEATE